VPQIFKIVIHKMEKTVANEEEIENVRQQRDTMSKNRRAKITHA